MTGDELIEVSSQITTLKALAGDKTVQKISVMSYTRQSTELIAAIDQKSLLNAAAQMADLTKYRNFFGVFRDLVRELGENELSNGDFIQEIFSALDDNGIEYSEYP